MWESLVKLKGRKFIALLFVILIISSYQFVIPSLFNGIKNYIDNYVDYKYKTVSEADARITLTRMTIVLGLLYDELKSLDNKNIIDKLTLMESNNGASISRAITRIVDKKITGGQTRSTGIFVTELSQYPPENVDRIISQWVSVSVGEGYVNDVLFPLISDPYTPHLLQAEDVSSGSYLSRIFEIDNIKTLLTLNVAQSQTEVFFVCVSFNERLESVPPEIDLALRLGANRLAGFNQLQLEYHRFVKPRTNV